MNALRWMMPVLALAALIQPVFAQRPGANVVTKNDLSQLALLYNTYYTDDPVPANVEEIKAKVKKDAPNIYKLIDNKDVEVVYHKQIRGDILVAYQKDVGKDGNHLAVFGDRSVKPITKEELAKLLK
jgi:hypothetical protein